MSPHCVSVWDMLPHLAASADIHYLLSLLFLSLFRLIPWCLIEHKHVSTNLTITLSTRKVEKDVNLCNLCFSHYWPWGVVNSPVWILLHLWLNLKTLILIGSLHHQYDKNMEEGYVHGATRTSSDPKQILIIRLPRLFAKNSKRVLAAICITRATGGFREQDWILCKIKYRDSA